jgi:hypothetical protein
MSRLYSGLGSNETQEESSLSICLKKCLDKYLKLYISQTEWMDSEPQPGLEPESLGPNPEVEFELTVYLITSSWNVKGSSSVYSSSLFNKQYDCLINERPRNYSKKNFISCLKS